MSRVAILVGSLRRQSFSRKTAKAALALAPEELDARLFESGELVT